MDVTPATHPPPTSLGDDRVTLELGAMLLCREFYLRVRGQGNHGVMKVLYISPLNIHSLAEEKEYWGWYLSQG